MFSWEYCKTFKNTFFEEHLQMAASVLLLEAYSEPYFVPKMPQKFSIVDAS